MANEEQLKILRKGVKVWNEWRKKNPDTKIELKEADLYAMDLDKVDFSGADLEKASLENAKLYEANLIQARLVGASLIGAKLIEANLSGANLSQAKLFDTDFSYADLSETDLTGAMLAKASLVGAKVHKSKLSGSWIYAVNVWDLEGEFEEQNDLVITRKGQPEITVDNIKVAQFIFLLLENKEIRDVIDTVTTKSVLILGRFYDERKQVLDALKEALRERGYVPILFDFEPSKQRDLTETIQLLANMAKFVIADITDAKSIPQELSHIIPLLPSVPVQPIILISEREYAMFEHWRSFKTVLPEFPYRDKQDLVDNLEAKILQPINAWRKDQDEISVLRERIKELEAKKS